MPALPLVLIVANRTAATPQLLEAVADRAARSPCRFHLLMPSSPHGVARITDPGPAGHTEAEKRMREALPVLSAAAGRPVAGRVSDADPLAAVQDAIHELPVEEILISTLPARISRWLHVDLVSKVRGLGLPVTHVEAHDREPAGAA